MDKEPTRDEGNEISVLNDAWGAPSIFPFRKNHKGRMVEIFLKRKGCTPEKLTIELENTPLEQEKDVQTTNVWIQNVSCGGCI